MFIYVRYTSVFYGEFISPIIIVLFFHKVILYNLKYCTPYPMYCFYKVLVNVFVIVSQLLIYILFFFITKNCKNQRNNFFYLLKLVFIYKFKINIFEGFLKFNFVIQIIQT